MLIYKYINVIKLIATAVAENIHITGCLMPIQDTLPNGTLYKLFF
jgi:hypothetical protein